MANLYHLLGIDRRASAAEIRRAFLRRSKEVHPDVNSDNSSAEEEFKRLNEAYQILSDPALRRQYDEQTYQKPEATSNAGAFTTAAAAFQGGSHRGAPSQARTRRSPWAPYFILYGLLLTWILSLAWGTFQTESSGREVSTITASQEKQRFLALYQNYPDLISTREAEVITGKKHLPRGFTNLLENLLQRGDTALFRKLILLQTDPQQYRQSNHEEKDQRRAAAGTKGY